RAAVTPACVQVSLALSWRPRLPRRPRTESLEAIYPDLPEDRPAPATLAQEVVPHTLGATGGAIHSQDGQRLAAATGSLGPTPAQKPSPEAVAGRLRRHAVLPEEMAQPAPADVQGRVEAQPRARPNDRVQRRVAANVNRPESAHHGTGLRQ